MTAFLLAPLLSLACAARSEPPELAGGVVQSQEWHVARSTAGVEREEFIGEVRYQAGQTAARCDHALYRHAERTWSLDGHVRLDKRLPSGDRLQAQGDSAFLNMGRRSGWLEGKPVLLSRQPEQGGPSDYACAERLEWREGREVSLTGEVHSWGPRLASWSDRADYDEAGGLMVLSGGRPVLLKQPGWSGDDAWSAALKADTVRAWKSPRRLTADGSVVGWLRFARAPGGSS